MSDYDLIQKGQDGLSRRGDALKAFDWGDIYGRNAQDAINAIPAVHPTVKPLVWKHEADNAWASAHYTIHQYWPHNNGMFCISGYLGGIGALALGKHPTLEAAKAAAQTDYEARILSALDMQPTVSPDVAALLDAAEKVINSYWHSTDGVITGIYDLEAALARVKGKTK